MIKVIIFDLDGVLVDTKMIHFEALNLSLKKYGYEEISIDDHVKVFDGLPTNEKLKILNRKDKIGFKTPDKKWIKLLEPKILSWIKNLDQIPFINKNTAKKVITNELKKKGELKQETWRIINFCKWYEVMKVDLKD